MLKGKLHELKIILFLKNATHRTISKNFWAKVVMSIRKRLKNRKQKINKFFYKNFASRKAL